MARSLKKGPFVHHSLEKKVMKNIEENKKSVIKTWSRASLITPDFVGQTIGVHNGKTFVPCIRSANYFFTHLPFTYKAEMIFMAVNTPTKTEGEGAGMA
jgi:small subunit ribosomal protein S19